MILKQIKIYFVWVQLQMTTESCLFKTISEILQCSITMLKQTCLKRRFQRTQSNFHCNLSIILQSIETTHYFDYYRYNFSALGFVRGGRYDTPVAFLKSGMTLPSMNGEKFIQSSMCEGDKLMDDALDAVSDVFSVDTYTLAAVDLLLNSYKSPNSAEERLHDSRLLAMKAYWGDLPYWFDAALLQRGREVLLAHADRALSECMANVLPIILSSPQTVRLLKYTAAEARMLSSDFTKSMEIQTEFDPPELYKDLIPLVDIAVALSLDVFLNICSFKEDNMERKYTFNDGFSSYGGHLSRGSPVWAKLVKVRAYFSIIRRRAMCLFGADRWPYEQFGLPLSQAYCTFLLSVCATAMVKSISGCSPQDEHAVLMLW